MTGGALSLGDVIGQPMALRILRAALPPGRPAHAYLFTGPEGVGKYTAAAAFARELLCESWRNGPCGACPACVKTAAGQHPDVIIQRPEAREKKVTEEIDIEHVREIIRKLGFKPYEARRKVLIVDGMDTMNVPAMNAFLKTLEEPPGDTVIILVAVNARKLLPTIISRCQGVRFNPVPFAETVEFLKRTRGMDDGEARLAAALSKGSPGRAISGGLDEEREIRGDAISIVLDGAVSAGNILRLASAMDKAKDRSRADRFLEKVVELVRDLAAMKIHGKYDSLINIDIASRIGEAAARTSRRRLLRAYEVTQEMIAARRVNINPLLVVTLLALELKE